MVAASAAVETPLGVRAGVLAAARTLHDLGRGPLGGRRPYGYGDALVTAVVRPSPGQELKSTGFWNEESVVLAANDAPDDARWANRAASVRYRADVGDAALEVTAGISGYDATLPLQPTQRPGKPPPAALLASARTGRARVLAELAWGSAAPLRAGLFAERLEASFAARELGGGPSARLGGSAPALGVFLDVTRILLPGLTTRAGLRVDHFGGSVLRLAPRGALAWELGPAALLTVAAGRYHQPTRSPRDEVERTLSEVGDGGAAAPLEELLPVASADHLVLSLDQRLGERVTLSLQGFWKAYRRAPRRAAGGNCAELRDRCARDRRGPVRHRLGRLWAVVVLVDARPLRARFGLRGTPPPERGRLRSARGPPAGGAPHRLRSRSPVHERLVRRRCGRAALALRGERSNGPGPKGSSPG